MALLVEQSDDATRAGHRGRPRGATLILGWLAGILFSMTGAADAVREMAVGIVLRLLAAGVRWVLAG